MKHVLMTGVLLAALGTLPAVAQDQPQGGDRRQQMQDRMAEYAERLKLSDAQKQQMTDLLKEEAGKMRDLRDKYQGGNGDRRAMMQDMKAIQDDMNARVAKFLSKDQMKEWNKIQDENQQRRRENMRRRRGGNQ